MNLNETLENYTKSDIYPFHMPGHKRNMTMGLDPYAIDMTEVDGVDDLHDPTGVIKEEQAAMAKLYGVDYSHILVGGSTVGILSAIYAAMPEGAKLIIQRNAHKSVYNAAVLRHCKVDYILPKLRNDGIYEAITLTEVRQALEKNPDAAAIVVTTPTYEGFHAPVDEIVEYCHKKQIKVIVDQAHGAHLGFSKEFCHGAAKCADITVQSLHKTLPALTQTAVLHVKEGLINDFQVREALDIFETSSPSYVLMNSVSKCIRILENSTQLFDEYVDNLEYFYTECGQLKNIKIVNSDFDIKDPGKLIISTKYSNITGVELAKKLREIYKIESEMSSFAYVLAMTSIMDTKEGFKRLTDALLEIDATLSAGEIELPAINYMSEKMCEPWQAKASKEKLVAIDEIPKDAISAGMVCIYPPGAPLIVPGEKISTESIALIKEAIDKELHVTGISSSCLSVVF